MKKETFIIAIVIIALVFIIGLLGMRSWTLSAENERATLMSASLLEYVEDDLRGCGSDPKSFDRISLCLIRGAAAKGEEEGLKVEESGFINAYPPQNETGYIIVDNAGDQTLDSFKFTLLKNLQVVDEGCVIEGEIGPGYACRLNFETVCEDGDVLDVQYDGEQVYLLNC